MQQSRWIPGRLQRVVEELKGDGNSGAFDMLIRLDANNQLTQARR